METSSKRPHVGRNIKAVRLFRGLSQQGLASSLEEVRRKPFSQQSMSEVEDKETLEDSELLRQIAEILHVQPEALTDLDWDNTISVIGNTFNNNDSSTGNFNLPIYHQSTIHQTYHPVDKFLEFFEKERNALKGENESLKSEIERLKKGKKK